ncbi:MAG: hypothetical protein CME62_03465 [Halobacteriovoraceae bacterium]|nr:hypothetical protein [Halobacteriovoraceae bacterium]|tara:strand:- start:46933 stop:48030 length:1098 start_codon:yes stop_codon:yes gene_type:complete
MHKALIFLILVSCSQVDLKLEKPYKKDNPLRVSWVKNLDPAYKTGNLPIGTSSPFIHQDIVYMGNLKGEMVAYDLETGRTIWHKDEQYPIQSQANFFNNHIYYGSKSGRLFARHYVTGELKYSIDLGAPIESQPIFHQGRALVHLRNHTIICLDAETGKIFWLYQRSVPYNTTLQKVSAVKPQGNRLYVGFADGNVAAISLEEGTILWEEKISTGLKFVDVDVTPVFYKGYIVAGSAAGPMRFLKPENGVIERTVEFTQSHTPFIAEEGMYVGSVFGDLALIDEYGKIQKQKKLSENGISSIVPYKNNLMVSTYGSEVLFVNKKTFDVTQTLNLGYDQSAIFGELVVFDEYLAFYSSRNRLYVIK